MFTFTGKDALVPLLLDGTRSTCSLDGRRSGNHCPARGRRCFSGRYKRRERVFATVDATRERALPLTNSSVKSGRLEAVAALRKLLETPRLHLMPCCFDALSAKMIHSTGFSLTFMTGFGVAASFGLPDTGLLSFGEIRDRAARIMEALPANYPVIGDGDTGYGNPVNVKRTVKGFAQAGLAGILIEDQINPKRCGHTQGKAVVDRADAVQRWRAAIDARNEFEDLVIIARTDAIATHGFDEALWRMQKALELGADVLFLEAPRSVAEMERFTRTFPGVPMLANMLENGVTPILPAKELEAMGYRIAAYPLTLLAASMKAMQTALVALQSGEPEQVAPHLMDFKHVRDIVGFPRYDEEAERYRSD
ncbi:hypothetical protein F1559_000771 [Cyanidiococcus yangmingshanensis]|uniref:Carboxyvinyl-carboxyphosphonate phosphorylmutase n=1 Tax=Cyanidiococcus yangmingshanensis TaxID=2690220 RepID=A0A7J7IMT3_9RHOD|nr:hypothetical protein F1559_000771 [Cyanidiococcus yangmingshanensis]